MSDSLGYARSLSQEIQPEKSSGMWIFFLSTKRKEGENQSPRELGLEKLRDVGDDIFPWAPRLSENYNGVVGCIINDVMYTTDIYLSGWKIRTILEDLAADLDMYYKTNDAIDMKLSSQRGNKCICLYKLSRRGIFSKRKDEDRSQWDVIVKPGQMDGLYDRGGIWLIFLSTIRPKKDDLSPRERALKTLLAACSSGKIALWEPENGQNEEGVIGCPLPDVENLINIYQHGKLIRDILSDQAEDVELLYKTREAIDRKLYSADGNTEICDYKLSNLGVFFKRNEVGRKWKKVSLLELED